VPFDECSPAPLRDATDQLAERGITVTYKTTRQWCAAFGLEYGQGLRPPRGRQGGTGYRRSEIMKLDSIRTAIRYNLVIQKLLGRLQGVGISIEPFYVIQEGVGATTPLEWGDRYRRYTTCFLGEEDMPLAAKCSGGSIEIYLDRLARGHECFGVRDGDRIVALMWCDPKRFHLAYSFDLKDNEVYLYAATTDRSDRGRNLAPYMREHAYRALRNRGIDVFYSASDFFNAPAVRFKQKLGAKFLKLCLLVRLGNKREWVWVLKAYPTNAVPTER
jgi:hypothetical protein